MYHFHPFSMAMLNNQRVNHTYRIYIYIYTQYHITIYDIYKSHIIYKCDRWADHCQSRFGSPIRRLAICRAWRRRAPVHSCAALAAWRRMALVILSAMRQNQPVSWNGMHLNHWTYVENWWKLLKYVEIMSNSYYRNFVFGQLHHNDPTWTLMTRISSSWVPQAQQTDALEVFWLPSTREFVRIPCQPWVNLSTNHGATCLLVGAGWVGPLSRTIAKQLIVAADLIRLEIGQCWILDSRCRPRWRRFLSSHFLTAFCAVILLLEFICKIRYFILLLTFPWRLASPTSSLHPSDRWAGLARAVIHSCAVLTHGRRGANMFAAPAGHWASFFVRCTGVVPREKAVEGALAQDLAFIAGWLLHLLRYFLGARILRDIAGLRVKGCLGALSSRCCPNTRPQVCLQR